MNDVELSRKLALAIGWKTRDYFINYDTVRCWELTAKRWRPFDYRDWNVIGPIAERYDCFPKQLESGRWCSRGFDVGYSFGATPQMAIALLVVASLS